MVTVAMPSSHPRHWGHLRTAALTVSLPSVSPPTPALYLVSIMPAGHPWSCQALPTASPPLTLLPLCERSSPTGFTLLRASA